jgi:O-antigen ligase
MIYLLGGYMWLFIHRPFEVWPWLGELHIERVYMIVTILYWALTVDKHWIPNRLNAAFAFFWLVMLASCLFSPFRSNVEDYFKVAVFYVLIMTSVRDERDLRLLVAFYVAAVGLYMAHSLREYNCGQVRWDMGTYRMVGVDKTYNDPNTFAATIVYSLTMALPLWPECREKWQRWAILAYVALGITCVLLTGSRTGLAGLCVLAAVLVLLSKYRVKLALLAALAAPVIWVCLPLDRQNRFLTLWDPSYGPANAQVSAESRWQGWHDGVRIWKEHILLGVGPGAFGQARGYNLQAHQLYGQVLGELGTLGAIAFGCLVLAFLGNWIALRHYIRTQPHARATFESRLVGSVMLAVVLMLLLGFGGHNLYRYTWLWFGAFQAIALLCLLKQNSEFVDDAALATPGASEPVEEYGSSEEGTQWGFERTVKQ